MANKAESDGTLPFPPPYPTDRPKFFASKLIRLMAKKVVASKIGVEAAYLITTVVMQEDSARYKGPVVFHWEILAAILGFGSWERLDRARKRACDAGWLVYVPARKGTDLPGEYWATLPDGATLEDDGYVGEPIRSEDVIKQEGQKELIDDMRSGRLCISQNADGSVTVSQNADASLMLHESNADAPRIALYYYLLPFTLNKDAASQASVSGVPQTDQNPTGKKPKKTPVRKASPDDLTCGLPFPPILDVPAFRDAWAIWIQHHHERRSAPTPTAVGQQLKKCTAWGVSRAVAAIENSVAGNYTGLFEEKSQGNGNGRSKPEFIPGPGQQFDPAAGQLKWK